MSTALDAIELDATAFRGEILGPADPTLVADVEAVGATVVADDRDPLVQLADAHRLAVALAESRGLDPDTPRHLTRSVVLG